jgi:hypothetical protein
LQVGKPQVEASPNGRCRLGAEKLLGRSSASALAAVVAFVVTISTISSLRFEHVLSAAELAVSPRRVAEGKLWLIPTSGLIATRPAVLAVASFALLAVSALLVCGPRIFWRATILGHIGATGMAYLVLGLARVSDPSDNKGLVTRLDFGVSAMQAAWLGAAAAVLWLGWAHSLRRRVEIVAACAGVGLVAYLAKPGLTLLDVDHGFAFVIGVGLVTRAQASRMPKRRSRATADAVAI